MIRAQPCDVLPRQRRVELLGEVGSQAAARRSQRDLTEADDGAHILDAQPLRKMELVADVALAPSEQGCVDGEDDRAHAGRFRSSDEGLRGGPVAVHVELKPDRAARGGCADVLDARVRERRQAHDRPRAGRCAHRGKLAVGAREPVEGGRCNEHGHRHSGPQDARREVARGDVDQNAIVDCQASPRGDVLAKRVLFERAARVVRVRHRRELLAGELLELVQVQGAQREHGA